jgi:hypothetical protein
VRRMEAAPAATSLCPVKLGGLRGNTRGFELLRDLGKELGRSCSRRSERSGSLARRRPWRSGGSVPVWGSTAAPFIGECDEMLQH